MNAMNAMSDTGAMDAMNAAGAVNAMRATEPSAVAARVGHEAARRRGLRALLAVAVAAAGTAVRPSRAAGHAQAVSDAGTVVTPAVLALDWRQPVPGKGADDTIEGRARVALQLDLSPWMNQTVRLFLVLPPAIETPIVAHWLTQGRLQSGSARSGTRALIYAGRVTAPTLRETWELRIVVDGRRMRGRQALRFGFEVDV